MYSNEKPNNFRAKAMYRKDYFYTDDENGIEKKIAGKSRLNYFILIYQKKPSQSE